MSDQNNHKKSAVPQSKTILTFSFKWANDFLNLFKICGVNIGQLSAMLEFIVFANVKLDLWIMLVGKQNDVLVEFVFE